MSSLFRPEAIEAKKQQSMGEILLVRPLSLTFFTTLALMMLTAGVLFLAWGEFTRKQRVSGRVVSTKGVAKIYTPISGTVVKKMVQEGDVVGAGQALYVVSVDRTTLKGGTQGSIGERIASKRTSLMQELQVQKSLIMEEDAALRRKLIDLSAQIENIKRESATQKKRLDLSEATLARYRELSSSRYISPVQLSDREHDQLDQQSRYQALQRTELDLSTQLAAVQSALKSAPLNAKNRLSNIERGISSVEQEGLENEARREIVITALQGGKVSVVLAEIGQTVGPSVPMLSILPDDAEFEANLYVPSKAIGFMQEGGAALLRYESFPYQKFGQYGGTIKKISRSTLNPAELQLLNAPPESLYRVTVSLEKQHVLAYGKTISLQDGMVLEADVLLDRRKLYEWLLEPLYSLSGKM